MAPSKYIIKCMAGNNFSLTSIVSKSRRIKIKLRCQIASENESFFARFQGITIIFLRYDRTSPMTFLSNLGNSYFTVIHSRDREILGGGN